MKKNKKLNCILLIAVVLCAYSSCGNKTEKNNLKINEMDYSKIFPERNENEPIYPLEYYKEEIRKFQKILPELRQINTITKIDNIIPGLLCFLVGWNDFNAGRGDDYDIISNASPRGNFFGLYTFDKNQNITSEYLVGYKNYINNAIRQILLEKLPGNKLEYGMISIGDFNNDGITEILSFYLHPPLYEYVFTVFGYNFLEDNFIPILLAPVLINFEQPFPSVEYLENGFRILEVLEYEPLELKWTDYLWDKDVQKYVRD